MTDMAASAPVSAALSPPLTPRQVAAGVIGNALEFYDFTTYAFFAVQIGDAFVPGQSEFAKLMLSLAAFGAGFILRPVGALVIGRYADKAGRRPAMLFSFALMGVSILGLALTPGYRTLGLAAPILVVFWRLCQGFALGGEVGPTTAFLVEGAPLASRGLYGAWQGASQNMASIVGGAVGFTIAAVAGPEALASWGWRVAFLLGAVVLPFGLILRRALPETLHRREAASVHHPDQATLRAHVRPILLGLVLVASATVSTYLGNFMTTYAKTTLHMSASSALSASIANGTAGVFGGLLGGYLSDRLGRKPMMIWPRIAFLLGLWPGFFLMVRNHDAATLLAVTATLAFLSALSTAAVFVGIIESLRKEVRGMAMGGLYAIAVAVFGGTTQPVIAGFTHLTGDPMFAAWYVMAATFVGLIAAALMRETAPARTRH
jgi:MHS family citrate/tricarballylate:H+ symporter-like MFS transporter